MTGAVKAITKRFAAAGGGSFNPETDIAWKSLLWAEDTVTTKPADEATQRYWSDPFSGGANYFDSGTNTARWVVYDTSVAALNNKPGLKFTSTVQGWGGTGNLPSALSQPYSVVYIGQSASGLFIAYMGGANDVEHHSSGGLTIRAPTFRTSSVSPTPYSTARLNVWVVNGASSKVALDGATPVAVSGDVGSNTATAFQPIKDYLMTAGHAGAMWGLVAGDITAHAKYASMVAWSKSHYGTP